MAYFCFSTQTVFLVMHLSLFFQTTCKGGAYIFDIHFWIGKDSSQVGFNFCTTTSDFSMLAANDISYAQFSKLLLLLRRMKLELPRLRRLNLTACSGVVRYSTGNHNATSLINSFRILNPASYPWRVVLLLGLRSQRWTSLKHGYIFAKGRELSELKRCTGVPPPCLLPICLMSYLSQS